MNQALTEAMQNITAAVREYRGTFSQHVTLEAALKIVNESLVATAPVNAPTLVPQPKEAPPQAELASSPKPKASAK